MQYFGLLRTSTQNTWPERHGKTVSPKLYRRISPPQKEVDGEGHTAGSTRQAPQGSGSGSSEEEAKVNGFPNSHRDKAQRETWYLLARGEKAEEFLRADFKVFHTSACNICLYFSK